MPASDHHLVHLVGHVLAAELNCNIYYLVWENAIVGFFLPIGIGIVMNSLNCHCTLEAS